MKHSDRAQESRILSHLQEGNHITPLEAFRKFSCLRLGARIYQLKRDGHRINTQMVKEGSKRFAKYSLA